MKKLLLTTAIATSLVLAGCDSDEKADFSEYDRENITKTQDLYYSYPMAEQTNVAPNSPIVLAFMVAPNAQAEEFSLEFETANGELETLTFASDSLKVVNDGKGVMLTPSEPLATNTTYTLKFASSDVDFPSSGLSFTTRPANKGPLVSRITNEELVVESFSPDGQELPFADFSSMHVSFSQPLDLKTITASNIKVEQGGKEVATTLLAKGRMLTIDPAEDLTANEKVTVTIEGVKSELGEELASFSKTLLPQDTTPRATQALEVFEAASCDEDGTDASPLTGLTYNCIPVLAKLIGDDANNPATVSSQSGDVHAELAYTPNFPNKTPLRISKGTLLNGSSLKVMIGGEVYAGFDSGPVTATFVSDANGYLLDNPYTDDPNAPKRMIMTADLAFDTAGAEADGTAESRANGAFTQKLMHVTMVGTANVNVETGRLVADAVSVVELNVLGLDEGYGVLSFHMESYADQTTAPEKVEDTRPLELSAWLPGETEDTVRPGDPIILLFNKPIAPNSVEEAVQNGSLSVALNGQDEAFDWRVEGTSLVLTPETDLQYSSTSEPAEYSIRYNSDITDTAGNNVAKANGLSFVMPVYASEEGNAPIVNTLYPGFPCVTEGLDLANGIMGSCISTPMDEAEVTEGDELPITSLPANRPIYATFSQVMNPTTINANSVKVEQCESTESCASATEVEGTLNVSAREFNFVPKQPWVKGELYRYTLKSADSSQCASNDVICSEHSLALQTNLLGAPGREEGGEDLVVYFYGDKASNNVLQRLRNFPTADVDASFTHDEGEPKPIFEDGELLNPEAILNSTNLDAKSWGGLLKDVNVGCEIGTECPDKKFIYMTAQLNTDVLGYRSAEEIQQLVETGEFSLDNVPDVLMLDGNVVEGAVLVHILPTQMVTSALVTYAMPIIGSAMEVSTGAQVMRMRYQKDPKDNNRTQPITGWIVDTDDGPMFMTKLDLLLDAPYMEKLNLLITTAPHNLHEYNLDDVALVGRVSFLDDGRLQIEQLNTEAKSIEIQFSGSKLIEIEIPENGINLNYISEPVMN